MKYGSEQHAKFVELVEQVREALASGFASQFFLARSKAEQWGLSESMQALTVDIDRFQKLCDSVSIFGIDSFYEETYASVAKALADRLSVLADEGYFTTAGRQVLLDFIAS